MILSNIFKKVAKELGIPEDEVSNAYSFYFKFIRDKIKELPLDKDLTGEEFRSLKTDFNISGLGKFRCTYKRYRGIKKYLKRKYEESKKD